MSRQFRAGGVAKWLRRVGVFGGIAGSMAVLLDPGGGAKADSSAAPSAGLDRGSHVGSYTTDYDEGMGFCPVDQLKDPINVIFAKRGMPDRVSRHATDHGGWEVHTNSPSSTQCFLDHLPEYGSLQQQHDSNASNNGACRGRYHMRYRTGSHPDGSWDFDPSWGFFAAAAAHHEDEYFCGHVVDHNLDPFDSDKPYGVSGFDMGRNDILENWVMNGPHSLLSTEDWGNTQPMRQADGEYSWSDGWVYYITMPTGGGKGFG